MHAHKLTLSILKAALISLLLVFKINPLFAQGDWELRTDKDGIKIYTSAVPD